MRTPEFRRHFVEFVPEDTLMRLRLATKGWKAAADAFMDEGVESGEVIVHDGEGISHGKACDRRERRQLVTRANFLLNITKVGMNACHYAVNLVVVDIPVGFETISDYAFAECSSLIFVSFPTTLTSIGTRAFYYCSILENVELLHTNLQKLGNEAFQGCSELKSMTIPGSLQTLGGGVFHRCYKLLPIRIDRRNTDSWEPLPDTTPEVIAHLRSKQNQS
ncbi:hypothetical protein TrLO_g9 [Triparma laevis f. longispina]|uniref:Uncharacterized protein n=1 Tax=Triparma laevis f. longispina TaxID=1714387 RepID=A0A9W7ECZ1_9STRA|nr:hypothetical protein TrLO_g9 [Triparma laevis f. longispina]